LSSLTRGILAVMSHAARGAQGEAAPQEMRDALAAMIRDQGETTVVRRFGIGRQTLARLVGGLPVRAGTLALMRAGLSTQSTSDTPVR
jgi:hypothetical protein